MTIDRVEYDLKNFIEQYEKTKNNFENDLDLIERDIANIERLIQIKVRKLFYLYFNSIYFIFLVKTIRYYINNRSIK
jgi:hypothetical protein